MKVEQARAILAPKQVEIMRHYRRPERMLVAVGAAQSGKALDNATPILTVDGWKTMGTLQVGDRVYDEAGQPTVVTGVFPQGDREAWRVHFGTHRPPPSTSWRASIVADADHLWVTTPDWRDGAWASNRPQTTDSIRRSRVAGGVAHQIPLCGLSPLADAEYVYVSGVEPAGTVPMTCIAVDSPNHLFLAGRELIPTHNTVASCQAFALWSQAMRPGGTFIVAGQSVASVLEKVVFGDRKLLDALTAVSPNPPVLKTSQGARILVPQDDGTVSRYLIYGGDDEGDRKRLQGLSANGALLDEAALLAESFYMMLTTRLSDPRTQGHYSGGAKMWLTLNPEGKQHWLKKRIVDKKEELKARVITFTLDDNPYLPPGYKESLLASLVGHYKVRLYEGEWADASGLVFPVWHHAEKIPENITRYSVGYDYGDSTVTAAILFAHTDGVPTVLGLDSKRVAISEYYWDSRVKGYRSQKDHLDAIQTWLKPFTGGEYLVVFGDPSTPEGVQRMFRDKGMSFQEAENAVVDGIATTASALVTQDVTIYVPGCPNLVREIGEYRWDEKAMERGEDKPMKVADHTADACRYNVSSSPRIARVVTGMM